MRKKRIIAPDGTAAIYARYSSANQRDESLTAQIRACQEYAKNNNLQIIKVYSDAAKTGTNTNREQFMQMFSDGKEGLFRTLLIHKFDRFSRDKEDSIIFKRELRRNGVNIVSVTEKIDASTPAGKLMESMLEVTAEFFSNNLAFEVMKGMKESAYDCKHLGGCPPLGYDVDPVTKKYVVNEPEASIVRYIFSNYADGVGYGKILEYLNSMGYKSKRGRAFGKNSLHDLLKNPKYKGTYIFNRQLEKDVTGKRNPQPKPENEWIVVPGGCPAIIDEDMFNTVQSRMANNRKQPGRFKAKKVYLLSGLVRCGECGAGMLGHTRPNGRRRNYYSSYSCSNRRNHKGCENPGIQQGNLDSFVLDQLYTQLFTGVSLHRLAGRINEYNQEKGAEINGELNRLEEEAIKVNRKIGDVLQLVSEDVVAHETIRSALSELEKKKIFLEKQLKQLRQQNHVPLISKAAVVDLINRSKSFIKTYNLAECRNLIQHYVEKVAVYRDHVEVLFKINVADEANDIPVPLKSHKERGDLLKKRHKRQTSAA